LITNYTELQAAVSNWLDRDDLTNRVPEFIQLAEVRMKRELRTVVTVAPLVIADADVATALPADCAELRSVRHNGTDRDAHIKITTPWGLDPYRELGVGIPEAAAVVNNYLRWNVGASGSFNMEIIYFATITPLSASVLTNTELTTAPDLYLFGALCEAAPFLEHDTRVALWESKYQAALTAVNASRESAELGAGPVAMALPVVFG
jgi:hypothetical protein